MTDLYDGSPEDEVWPLKLAEPVLLIEMENVENGGPCGLEAGCPGIARGHFESAKTLSYDYCLSLLIIQTGATGSWFLARKWPSAD
jgi:hypothetical protein